MSAVADRLEVLVKEQKVLGVLWNVLTGDLVFDLNDIALTRY